MVTSDRLSSLPMLDVPGWLESQRLANAVAVVMALNSTARVSEEASRLVSPFPPGQHVIDLEGDADAEQQRQRNDVGES